MLALILDSALRSLLLGIVAWVLLKLLRLADTRTETAVWTAVLAAALAMPALRHAMPSLVLSLPWPAAPLSVGVQPLAVAGASPQAVATAAVVRAWLLRHGQPLLISLYAAGLSVCLARLAAGLVLTWRLYRSAVPVTAPWAAGRNIRASARLKSPVSVVRAILLTSDHQEWSDAKRDAVLAHEEAHIARGDFFVQLAAAVHCAFFWFSPFAWWLQAKLAEIAETASDDAAVLRLKDRVTYAEILIEVSRCAQSAPVLVGMAKRHFIDQRVEHILYETPARTASLPKRGAVLAVFTAVTLIVAGVKAVATSDVTPPPRMAAAAIPPAMGAMAAPRPAARTRRRAASPAASTRATTLRATAPPDDEVTYNPRALLDLPYVPRPDHLPLSTIAHAGRLFYVRSNEKPVADASVAYAVERR